MSFVINVQFDVAQDVWFIYNDESIKTGTICQVYTKTVDVDGTPTTTNGYIIDVNDTDIGSYKVLEDKVFSTEADAITAYPTYIV